MNALTSALPPELAARLLRPTIRLEGPMDAAMLSSFHQQLDPVLDNPGAILLQLYSEGGDAETGRRLAQEIRLLRSHAGHDMWFLGATMVASAAVTVMSAFPVSRRWATRDTTFLFHERRMTRDIHLDQALAGCRQILEEAIAEIDNGVRLEEEGFRDLIAGSRMDFDELRKRAASSWYVPADEALRLGLIGGVV
jgi:ATP-dependent protease ClpP protease subunit